MALPLTQQFREVGALALRCFTEWKAPATVVEQEETVWQLVALGVTEADARWTTEGYIAWCRDRALPYDWQWFRRCAVEAVGDGNPLWTARP